MSRTIVFATNITLVILGSCIDAISNLLAAVSAVVGLICCYVSRTIVFATNITLVILGSCIDAFAYSLAAGITLVILGSCIDAVMGIFATSQFVQCDSALRCGAITSEETATRIVLHAITGVVALGDNTSYAVCANFNLPGTVCAHFCLIFQIVAATGSCVQITVCGLKCKGAANCTGFQSHNLNRTVLFNLNQISTFCDCDFGAVVIFFSIAQCNIFIFCYNNDLIANSQLGNAGNQFIVGSSRLWLATFTITINIVVVFFVNLNATFAVIPVLLAILIIEGQFVSRVRTSRHIRISSY